MEFDRRTLFRLAAGAAAAPALSRPAWSQAYPTRPVRMIVPFAPGGQNDAIGRLIAQKLSENLGKQYIIENVGGGGGVVAARDRTACAPVAPPEGLYLVRVDY